ncbi:uncharacterized protein LY89DRAFT_729618 [Mollisia scopiformis]|uniref:Uncharacterized protein n=1 Tax=Mollisia scopiformis TaxID=149040 RepID=A0A194XPH4_MOLSC|nr:uncharacterized protein LY89DRAFT_729618 [Mollisia scopiformis]KUJ22150.1 hypothetical protein LY89DRAFT_729618 [Mollisia scopiformis]
MVDQNQRPGKVATNNKVAAESSSAAPASRSAHRAPLSQSAFNPGSPTKVDITYVRLPGASADITLSATGATLNKYKSTKSTYSNGLATYVKAYPFQNQGFDFVAHFMKAMSPADRVDFLAANWVEVVVELRAYFANASNVVNQLAKLGPEFTDHIKNLDIKLKLPPLAELSKMTLALLPASAGYKLIEEVVQEIFQFPAIGRMNVVLCIPHSIQDGIHDQHLSHALPFFPMSFTGWNVDIQAQGMYKPKLILREDLNSLNGLRAIEVKRKEDEELRVLNAVFVRHSIYEPETLT